MLHKEHTEKKIGITSVTEEEINLKNHISEILKPYKNLNHNNVCGESEKVLDISSSPSNKTIDSENFSQTDSDSELFDPLPFDKLEHKRNVISWEYEKKAESYWRNTKVEN